MKRQHVLVLVIVVATLSVAFFKIKSSPSHGTEATPEETAMSTPADGHEVEKETAAASPSTDTSPAAKTASNAAESSAEGTSQTAEEMTAEIQENLSTARKILQQRAAVEKAKPEEVHHMPKATLDAAKRLGEIAELEAKHPEQAESFKEFYLECARDENTMTVTRAQCLNKYMKAAKLDTAAQKNLLGDYPEEVVRLVEALQ